MPFARENVKRVLRWLGYVVLVLVILPVVTFCVLPDWLGVRVIFLLAVVFNSFGKWIGYAIASVLGGVALHWALKDRQRIRKRSFVLVSSLSAVYAVICLVAFFHQSSYERCDYYTKELNGGVRTVDGKQYTIQLCGTERLWGGGEEVRLQVLSEDGELLARRYFVLYWNDSGEVKLRHYKGTTIYYDAEADDGVTQSIHLPPARRDWITARLPLFD